jgi:hypothetical protein
VDSVRGAIVAGKRPLHALPDQEKQQNAQPASGGEAREL